MRGKPNAGENTQLCLSLTDMKRISTRILLLNAFLFVFNLQGIGQVNLEALAYYPGDYDALNAFLRKELVYPKYELKKGITGTVQVKFTIDSLGHTANHTIFRSASSMGLDEEALRVARLIDGFVPAKAEGKPVSSEFVLPIKFEIPVEPVSKGKSKKSGKK